MAELFWPTHELLEIPAGSRKVKVELQGILLLMYLVDRKAAVAETNWATRRPVIVSRATGRVITDAPLYVTGTALNQLWKARLIRRDTDGLDGRLLPMFL